MDVLELERQGWEALAGGSGRAFYREYMADDGLMVVPGAVLSKEEVLSSIDDDNPWADFSLDDERVVRVGDGVAVVAYRAEAKREGADGYVALMTTTYARGDDGVWRVVLHQQTPVPTP
jgi:ketosteroid isomerase-like protein